MCVLRQPKAEKALISSFILFGNISNAIARGGRHGLLRVATAPLGLRRPWKLLRKRPLNHLVLIIDIQYTDIKIIKNENTAPNIKVKSRIGIQ